MQPSEDITKMLVTLGDRLDIHGESFYALPFVFQILSDGRIVLYPVRSMDVKSAAIEMWDLINNEINKEDAKNSL